MSVAKSSTGMLLLVQNSLLINEGKEWKRRRRRKRKREREREEGR